MLFFVSDVALAIIQSDQWEDAMRHCTDYDHHTPMKLLIQSMPGIPSFVTGFGKTVPVHTRIEIHFIAYYNSHTQGLSRNSNTIAIDKKVCFYRRLFANPIKPCRTNSDPMGH